MNEPFLAQATADDLHRLAARRCKTGEERALWFYLAENSPNGAWVAKDDQTAIGVGIAHAMEDEWFLSELFVEPGFRGHGLGLQLLRSVAKDAGEVARSGILDPAEPGGAAFFARVGVPAQTPLFTVSGSIPREEELVRMAAGEYRFNTTMLEPAAHRVPINALDREIRGCSRPLDHEYFARSAHGVAFFLNNEFVGYAYVWANGRVGPMCAFSPTYLVQFFGFALAALSRVHGASWCTLLVPGTNIRVLRAAMRAGLTVEATHLFASDSAVLDLSRYVGLTRLLF